VPADGFLWVGSARREFELQRGRPAGGAAALDRQPAGRPARVRPAQRQLPSHFDDTSWYDLLVFRRLAAAAGSEQLFVDDSHGTLASARKALESIDTSPVGFAVFDRVLLTVHPTDCAVRDFFAQRLQSARPAGTTCAAAHGCPAARPT
jgi:magnesium transporter